jgi:hypothetical protein
MEPVGQASAQAPQSMQMSGSMEYTSPSVMAPVGHSPWQAPQATQVSGLILCAIVYLKLVFVSGLVFKNCANIHFPFEKTKTIRRGPILAIAKISLHLCRL